jgi:hypothetical protein
MTNGHEQRDHMTGALTDRAHVIRAAVLPPQSILEAWEGGAEAPGDL